MAVRDRNVAQLGFAVMVGRIDLCGCAVRDLRFAAQAPRVAAVAFGMAVCSQNVAQFGSAVMVGRVDLKGHFLGLRAKGAGEQLSAGGMAGRRQCNRAFTPDVLAVGVVAQIADRFRSFGVAEGRLTDRALVMRDRAVVLAVDSGRRFHKLRIVGTEGAVVQRGELILSRRIGEVFFADCALIVRHKAGVLAVGAGLGLLKRAEHVGGIIKFDRLFRSEIRIAEMGDIGFFALFLTGRGLGCGMGHAGSVDGCGGIAADAGNGRNAGSVVIVPDIRHIIALVIPLVIQFSGLSDLFDLCFKGCVCEGRRVGGFTVLGAGRILGLFDIGVNGFAFGAGRTAGNAAGTRSNAFAVVVGPVIGRRAPGVAVHSVCRCIEIAAAGLCAGLAVNTGRGSAVMRFARVACRDGLAGGDIGVIRSVPTVEGVMVGCVRRS